MADGDRLDGGQQETGALAGASSAVPRSRRWLWLAGLGLAVLGGAGFWVFKTCWNASGPEGPPAEAPQSAEGLVDDSARQESRELADSLVRDFPNSAAALHARAWLLVRWGDRTEALKCWEACLKLDPRFALAHYWLGKEAIRQGDYERAVPPLRRAMELDPNLSELGLQLGTALLKTNRTDEAIDVLEKHVARSPGMMDTYYLLGQALLHVGALDRAKKCYQAAAQIDPTSSRAYFGLAAVCTRLGETDKAAEYRKKVEECRTVERDDKRKLWRQFDDEMHARHEMAEEYTYVGRIYREHGRPQEAQECLEKAAASDPQHVASRRMLADLLQERNKTAEAVEVLKQLRQIEPANHAHLMNLGVLYLRLKQFDAAEEAFRRAAQLAPNRSDGHAALAQAYLLFGRNLPEARACAQKAVQVAPTAANHFLLGMACFRNGDSPAALEAIGKAMTLDPRNQEYRDTYRYIQQRQSEPKR